jgi:thiamine-phosphate pyrophosphorylase
LIVLVTDPRYSFEHLVWAIDRVREALSDEHLVVQYRDKVSSPHDRSRAIERLVRKQMRVVVNGTPEEARNLGAYGLHLPGRSPDLPRAREVLGDQAWISVAAHDDAAVEHAVRGRATAALVSPIFEVPQKGPPRGVDAVERAHAVAQGELRIIALGGIDSLRRAASCSAAGADGIAVIRAIFDAPDPARAALELSTPFRSP